MLKKIKVKIVTGFFRKEELQISFDSDSEELVLDDDNKQKRRRIIPYCRIHSIRLSLDMNEFDIRTDKEIIEGFLLETENVHEIIEELKSTFGILFSCR